MVVLLTAGVTKKITKEELFEQRLKQVELAQQNKLKKIIGGVDDDDEISFDDIDPYEDIDEDTIRRQVDKEYSQINAENVLKDLCWKPVLFNIHDIKHVEPDTQLGADNYSLL